jgi:beta-galactosidase
MVTFPFRSLILSGVLALFAFQFSLCQVVFREVPEYKIRSGDSLFFDISPTRSIIPLNGSWTVRSADDEEAPKTKITVPSIFEGEGELVFEKEFQLSRSLISKNTLELFFFSINYTADISLNNTIIYRHSGGDYPFKIALPRDILDSDKENILTLNLSYSLNSKNSIPQKQRFLFPQNFGGIIGDVFIYIVPDFYIVKEKVEKTFSSDFKNVSLEIETLVKNNRVRTLIVSDDQEREYQLVSALTDAAGNIVGKPLTNSFNLERNKDISISQKFNVPEALIWSPENPSRYFLTQQLFIADSLIDIKKKSIALFDLVSDKELIKLNGKDYLIKGVTFYPGGEVFGKLISYDEVEKDISMIKDAGFNSVRLSKSTVHPYFLSLCEKYGLFAFLDISINAVPSGIASDEGFVSRSREFLQNYISFYGDYSSFVAVGFGGTYLPQMNEHIKLISILSEDAKEKSKLITYASFAGTNITPIENLDLYGLEFIKNEPSEVTEQIRELQDKLGKGKVFFSSLTYPVYIGGSDGYLNEFSFEAQAKYYEDFFEYISENQTSAFFINSFNDYLGDYSSLICAGSDKNLYRLGLTDANRSKNRISYKVVYSKLNNLEKVTIPIGSKKDDSPMIFIIFGLLLAIFTGVLVNSGRKFRDDASRALLRPYNFFSDVRDQRIISASHTTLLGLIIAAVLALIVGNILFHLKTSLVFENLLLAFASPLLMKVVNYLAWHPLMSLLWITAANIVLFVIIALIIKIASSFVRTRVFLISVYFTFIWAMLPVVLLIPVGIILYRVLLAETINLYVYIGLGIVQLWVLYRLIKGIHVLLDSKPGTVYLYSIIFIVGVIGAVLFYFELKHSTVQYLLFTLKQFNIL